MLIKQQSLLADTAWSVKLHVCAFGYFYFHFFFKIRQKFSGFLFKLNNDILVMLKINI